MFSGVSYAGSQGLRRRGPRSGSPLPGRHRCAVARDRKNLWSGEPRLVGKPCPCRQCFHSGTSFLRRTTYLCWTCFPGWPSFVMQHLLNVNLEPDRGCTESYPGTTNGTYDMVWNLNHLPGTVVCKSAAFLVKVKIRERKRIWPRSTEIRKHFSWVKKNGKCALWDDVFGDIIMW